MAENTHGKGTPGVRKERSGHARKPRVRESAYRLWGPPPNPPPQMQMRRCRCNSSDLSRNGRIELRDVRHSDCNSLRQNEQEAQRT